MVPRHSAAVRGCHSAPNRLMLCTKALLRAIDVLKREVKRQREEKETLEANVREQVVSEMMEVISEMQDGFRCVLRTLKKHETSRVLRSETLIITKV